jgi:hypothetical protein
MNEYAIFKLSLQRLRSYERVIEDEHELFVYGTILLIILYQSGDFLHLW